MYCHFKPFLLCCAAAALTLTPAALVAQEAPAPANTLLRVPPALEGNRAPFEVAFTPDGSRALVTEFDEGTLAVIDTVSGKVLQHLSTGGKEPTGVAVTPDGARALVTNSFSGSFAVIALASGKVSVLPLLGAPYDVVVSPDGTTAYVSVSQLDHVAVIDLAELKVTTRIPTGRRPRALDLTPDGKTLVSANLQQGSVTFIDTAARTATAQGPTPAVNLRGVVVYPDGRLAYCVGQRAQNERPTETAVGIWSNQSFHVRPNGGRNGAENIWLDFIGKDVSDPDSVVFDPARQRVFITCMGGHSVNVLPLRGGDPKVVRGVGACPKGLAFTPDGREVWVANHLGNSVAVIDPTSLEVKRRIDLGPASWRDPNLLGRYLFSTATLTRGEQFSCNSCHPDGATDGIAWKFVHVPDAFGKEVNRNVRSLRGGVRESPPYRWTGHEKDLDEFVQHEVVGLLQSPKLEAAQATAIVDYLHSLRLTPNPYRNPDQSLTEAAVRGKGLFTGKAGCAECHTGPLFGGQRKAWIGTTPPGVDLDVPHLAGVYDTDPYLHDGRATSLPEIFEKDPQKLHGNTGVLTPEELKDLLQFVREL